MKTAKSDSLFDYMVALRHDPLGFVRFAFPWGQGPLLGEEGPDTWQSEVLRRIGKHSASRPTEAFRFAVASGHGIGKTALTAWIVLWFISTRTTPQIVVTANTKSQLDSKTWRELSKWHKLAVNREWFDWTRTAFYLESEPETWCAHCLAWSKERAEAFAGTHEDNVLVLYDEASAIDDIIWETTEGAMTTPGAYWLAFGNPTRNTGRFKECFGRYKHRWHTMQIDSRTAKRAAKEQLEQWVQDYGEDSDFVRVRVKGQFPRTGSIQFIGNDLVEDARMRQAEQSWVMAPKVLGVDVARHGDDQSVILMRQGLKVVEIDRLRVDDTVQLAGHIGQAIEKHKPQSTFIDATGIGWGVVDQLRALGHQVVAVQTGEKAVAEQRFLNLRAEIWDRMRMWLKEGGDILDDQELVDDLTGPEYGFDNRNRIQLEKKQDMKARGLASPDSADALALTFTMPVGRMSGGPIKRQIRRI